MGGVPHAFYAEEARNFLDEYEFARSFGLSNELIADIDALGYTPRIGSICSGYGGLDRAAEEFFGAETVWHVEYDAAPAMILEHHWPGVPNHHDLTTVDWSTVEPVDIVSAGFPCQDVSGAGRMAGLRPGTRTGLWLYIVQAIAVLRPRVVLLENVLGLLSADGDVWPESVQLKADIAARYGRVLDLIDHKLAKAQRKGTLTNEYRHRKSAERVRISRRERVAVAEFRRERHRLVPRAIATVLGTLAEVGYDARWTCVRASDIGAPHHRARVFIVATPADTDSIGRGQGTGQPRAGEPPLPTTVGGDATLPDTDGDPVRIEPVTERRGSGEAVARRDRADAPDTDSEPGRAPERQRSGSPEATGQRTSGISGGRDVLSPDTRGIGRDGRGATPGQEAGPHRATDRRGPGPVRSRGGLDASATESGSDQALQDMRGTAGSEEVQWPPRGSNEVPVSEDLRPELREQSDDSAGRFASVESEADPQGDGVRVRGDDETACPSQGSESSEQRSSEPANALLKLSPETPLAGGPSGTYRSNTRVNWGPYAAAVHRWERVLGRPSPDPTEPNKNGKPRLNARFAEFMMGLPEGWVTDVPGLSRAEQLKAIGNGVVPHQAVAALHALVPAALSSHLLRDRNTPC